MMTNDETVGFVPMIKTYTQWNNTSVDSKCATQSNKSSNKTIISDTTVDPSYYNGAIKKKLWESNITQYFRWYKNREAD